MNPQESRTRACKLAESLGWFLGQGTDHKPVLYRPGHAPTTYGTWLIALTDLMRLRELLPKAQALQPAPQAQAPPARVIPVAKRLPDLPPMARIVEVDKHGRIRRYVS